MQIPIVNTKRDKNFFLLWSSSKTLLYSALFAHEFTYAALAIQTQNAVVIFLLQTTTTERKPILFILLPSLDRRFPLNIVDRQNRKLMLIALSLLFSEYVGNDTSSDLFQFSVTASLSFHIYE